MEEPEDGEVHVENEAGNEQPHVVNGDPDATESDSEDDQPNEPEDESSTDSENEQDEPQATIEISEDDWNRFQKKIVFTSEDMNMLVMDFFLGKELSTVAQAFQTESGCPLRIDDLSLVETYKTVRNLIMNDEFDEAISFINETQTTVYFSYWPRLKFYLEQQKMIELCRRREFSAALNYSRKFIVWYNFKCMLFANPDDFKKECSQTLLLMLYGDDATSPVSYLLDPMRKSYIATYVVDGIKAFKGRKTGNAVESAMKMLRMDECYLNQVYKIPNFNFENGFPEPVLNPNKDFQSLVEGIQE